VLAAAGKTKNARSLGGADAASKSALRVPKSNVEKTTPLPNHN